MRTSLDSILCIVIRLGAVLLAVSTLGSVLSVVVMIHQGQSPADLAWIFGAWVATIAIAFLFWLYPGPLARLCSARSAHQVFDSPIATRDLQWIAFSVLGAYFVAGGIVGFVHYEGNLLIADAIFDREKRIEDFLRSGLYWLLQIVVGVALALGAHELTGMLHRLRHGDSPVHHAQERDA